MMKLTAKGSLLLATLVTSWVTSDAIAAGGVAPSVEPPPTTVDGAPGRAQWQLLESAENGTVELVARDHAGAVATVCQSGSCGVFVEPSAGCVPGSQYPLLINSARQVGVIASTCGVLNSNGSERYVVRIEPQNALFPSMIRGEDISIAFPTQGGEMNVIYISMEGVREHLRKLLPMTDDDGASPSAGQGPQGPATGASDAPAPLEQAESDAGPAPARPPFVAPDHNHFGGQLTATVYQL